ncbi:MAG: hypothetical protein QOI83_3787 [Streptomycetaceae bacterium]|nr:hypothetical protein [Streptomycetaceae bacterium]
MRTARGDGCGLRWLVMPGAGVGRLARDGVLRVVPVSKAALVAVLSRARRHVISGVAAPRAGKGRVSAISAPGKKFHKRCGSTEPSGAHHPWNWTSAGIHRIPLLPSTPQGVS